MSIFKFFRKAGPPLPSVEHPTFGRMQAVQAGADGTFLWEIDEPVMTRWGPISLSFDGPASGLSPEQVDMWDWVLANHELLRASAAPMLLATLTDFALQAQFDRLVWTSATLPPGGNRASVWELAFELPDGPILTVHFKNEVPSVVYVDS